MPFFIKDALFNNKTDIPLRWIRKQQRENGCTVVWISATADEIFEGWLSSSYFLGNDYYFIPKDYSYVSATHWFEKKQGIDLVNHLLANTTDKILYFAQNQERFEELHNNFGDIADYIGGKELRRKLDFLSEPSKIIQNERFSKRLLVSSSVIDNGVNLKDISLKHIITELFDPIEAIQCIGRKRPIDPSDTCSFYFMNHSKQSIETRYRNTCKRFELPQYFKKDKTSFMKDLETGKIDARVLSDNPAFVFDKYGKIILNQAVYKCMEVEFEMLTQMKKRTYKAVYNDILGPDISKVLKELSITLMPTYRANLITYLNSIVGKKLFKEEQKELESHFREATFKDRTFGLKTTNRYLEKEAINFCITSKQESASAGGHRKDTYWIVSPIL